MCCTFLSLFCSASKVNLQLGNFFKILLPVLAIKSFQNNVAVFERTKMSRHVSPLVLVVLLSPGILYDARAVMSNGLHLHALINNT